MLLKKVNGIHYSKYAVSLLIILTWNYVVSTVSAASLGVLPAQPDILKSKQIKPNPENAPDNNQNKSNFTVVHLNQDSNSKHIADNVKENHNDNNKPKVADVKKPEATTVAPVKRLDSDDAIGALGRGIWVAAGISLLVIMYIGWKTYRQRNKRVPMVRKYGIRARRSDIEMEPLQSDDEEDETVFDMKNVNN